MSDNPSDKNSEKINKLEAAYHIRDPALRAVFSINAQTPIPLSDIPHLRQDQPLALQEYHDAFAKPYDEDYFQHSSQEEKKESKSAYSVGRFLSALHSDLILSFETTRPAQFLFGYMLGIALYFTLPIEPSPYALLLPLLTCLMLWLLSLKLKHHGFIFLVLFIGFFGAGLAQLSTQNHSQPKLIPPPHTATITGRIWESSQREKGYSIVIEPISMSTRSKEELPKRLSIFSLKNQVPPRIGDIITVKARLDAPSPPTSPNGFDFGFFYHFRNIGGVGFGINDWQKAKLSTFQELPKISYLSHLKLSLDQLRESVSMIINQSLSGRENAFARALIVGDRSLIDKEAIEAMRQSGLAHVLAISGMHVALVSGAFYAFMRMMLVLMPALGARLRHERIAAVTALAASLIYLGFSGGAISTWRAVIMISIFYLAMILGRPALTTRNLIVAAFVILLIWPFSMLEAGFQMSFSATLALVLTFQLIQKLKQKQRRKQRKTLGLFSGILSKTLSFFGIIFISSLVAGAATAPFALYHFNNFAPLSILANLLAMPIISLVVMPSAIFSMMLMPYGLEAFPLHIMGLGISWIVDIAFWVSSLTPSELRPPRMSTALYLSTAAALLSLMIFRRRALMAIVLILLIGVY